VPREFIKLTAAKKLNAWLYEQGSITHFYETGDTRVFGEHTPNCAIFRFEKGRRIARWPTAGVSPRSTAS
jgi:adenine-specific DNA-methyltransferase